MSHFKRVQVNSVLYLTLLILIFISFNSFAVTVRSARVVVDNQTGKDIFPVHLIHKYSDNQPERLLPTHIIKAGERAFLGTVKYHTGAFTTGRDWWFINWVYFHEKNNRVYYSNPSNLRTFIDGLESAGKYLSVGTVTALVGAVSLACTGATAGACAPLAQVSIMGAIAISGALADQMMGPGKTAGFKQHILRSDDEGRDVVLTLYNNGKIKISSPSGTSWTVYNSKTAPPLSEKEKKIILEAIKAEEPTLVSIYQHCAYGGYRVDLTKGSHNMHSLINKGMRDNDVSAIKVATGYQATLYEHPNFKGRSWTFKGNDDCFVNNGLNDTVSSIMVTKAAQRPTPVSIYQHCAYGGYRVDLTKGSHNMHSLINKGMRDNDVSAIKVATGYQATLYEHPNFKGRSWTFKGNDDCFVNNGLNDTVSSIMVTD